MRLRPPLRPAGLLLGVCAALLAGCGSSTKTVSVAGAPALSPTTSSASTSTAPTPTPSTSTATPPPSTGGTGSSAPTTRTATAPAFIQQETKGQGASAAAAVVREHGYTPGDSSQYHPTQTLQVLVGTRAGSADGYDQRAFFFIDGHYLGTDASEPSASVKVVSQSDTEVTLAYPLYRKSDPLCCPGGGQATVHFQLNNGKLTPLGTIPPATSNTALARH